MIPWRSGSRTGLVMMSVPVAVIVSSYLWLVVDHQQLGLWNVVVHESGQYSLGQTVLYFRHFLREVPVDVGYALFLVAAGASLSPATSEDGHRLGGRPPMAVVAGLMAGLLLLIAGIAATREQSFSSMLLDLGQFRTRDDLVEYGSHWRFHWLSSIWFGVAAGWLGSLVVRGPSPSPLDAQLRRRLALAAWGYFALLTLAFGFSSEIFLDIRYAGHQAREILTHGPLTLLLGLALGRALAGSDLAGRSLARADPVREGVHRGRTAGNVLGCLLLAGIPVYLALMTLSGEPMEVGQSALGASAMIAGHIFEHTLDYLFVGLLSVTGYGLVSSGRQASRGGPG